MISQNDDRPEVEAEQVYTCAICRLDKTWKELDYDDEHVAAPARPDSFVACRECRERLWARKTSIWQELTAVEQGFKKALINASDKFELVPSTADHTNAIMQRLGGRELFWDRWAQLIEKLSEKQPRFALKHIEFILKMEHAARAEQIQQLDLENMDREELVQAAVEFMGREIARETDG